MQESCHNYVGVIKVTRQGHLGLVCFYCGKPEYKHITPIPLRKIRTMLKVFTSLHHIVIYLMPTRAAAYAGPSLELESRKKKRYTSFISQFRRNSKLYF